MDSDCILPPHYIQVVQDRLIKNDIDAFGGPDKADECFTTTQKAINYSMTSFLTTGGIRGGKVKLDKYYPRSFNMGYSKSVFQKTKGFNSMRYGEDIDMSMRIMEEGFKIGYVEQAYVYHKRRATFNEFFKQVFNFGKARINLIHIHPSSLKLVHFFPPAFFLGMILMVFLSISISLLFITLLILYFLGIFIDSIIKNKSLNVALKSIISGFIQLCGYGIGFIVEFFNRAKNVLLNSSILQLKINS